MASGIATFAAGSLSVTVDNNGGGNLATDQTFGPLNVSVSGTGLGSISPTSAVCTIGTGATPCQLIFYTISGTRAVLMDLTNGSGSLTDPSVLIVDK